MEVITEKATKNTTSEGYKRTEVGVIPEDWEVKKIEEISDVKGGKRLPTGWSLIKSKTPHPYIRVADMFQGGISEKNIKYVPEGAYQAIKNYRIFKNDLFISVAGTLGLIGKIPDSLDGANLTENADRLTNIKCFKEYFLYALMSPIVQRVIEETKTIGAQPKLALSRIRNFKVPLPQTLKEQRAIAEVLSDVDALIAELDALIEKKQQVKKGAMQRLLTGKKRLPGFSGEWEEKKLGDILSFQTGNPFNSKYFNENGFGKRLIKNRDLKSDEQVIYYSGPHSKTDVVENADLLVGMDGDFIPCLWNKGTALLNQRVGRINANGEINIKFLFYYIRKPLKNIQHKTSATTVKHLSHNDIEKMELPLPELEEQKAIAGILSDMDAEIQSLQEKRSKYEKVKQGMMQELLTGKTRLVSTKEDETKTEHNWQFDEATILSVLVDQFGNEKYPLGRFRRTKLTYLTRRFLEKNVDRYLKKAAGPYSSDTRYKGPEGIALNNNYVKEWENKPYTGFIAADNIGEARSYFADWYGKEPLKWFKSKKLYKKTNDQLELLTTIDKAIVELNKESRNVSLSNVKDIIESHPEWEEKLERDLFLDENIKRAIKDSRQLFY